MESASPSSSPRRHPPFARRLLFGLGAVAATFAVFVVAAWLVRGWWRAPSRWKDAATPPPGFEQALADLDAGRTEAGIGRLKEVRRHWTHPLWDRRAAFLDGWWSLRLQKLEPALLAFRVASDASAPEAFDRNAFCLGPLAAVSEASLLLRLSRPEEAARRIEPLVGARDLPWASDALELWARAKGEAGAPDAALQRIDAALTENPAEPEALRLLAGRLRQKRGDSAGAAAEFKKVWSQWPRTPEADRAAEALAALPQPHSGWTAADLPTLDERAHRLAEAGDTAGAVGVWTFARERIANAAADPRLRIRLGAALAADGQDIAARPLLSPVPADPALARMARAAAARIEVERGRLTRARELLRPDLSGADRDARRDAALLLAQGADRLEKDADALSWYESALPLMPPSPDRDQAAWRAGWLAFRSKRYERAVALFRNLDREEALAGFRSAALYWTARAEQARRSEAAGQQLLRLTLDRYRNDYYGLRASERLGQPRPLSARRRLPASDPVSAAADGLAGGTFAPPLDPADFPLPQRPVIAAAEELVRLHLPAEAFRALEFAARVRAEGRLSRRLADLALQRGDRNAALPWLRAAYPDLVREASPSLPARVAQALYPVDHWTDIKSAASSRSLDPWLVSSVILQESAFNPLAVSPAGACGLMQVLPDTGRDLVRQLGLGTYDRQRLFDPHLNVVIGTTYLSNLLDRYNGRPEPALAAYNAGISRADRWWPASGRDPETFVEDIPFVETRLYVKRILSQWWMYRVLYDGAQPAGAG